MLVAFLCDHFWKKEKQCYTDFNQIRNQNRKTCPIKCLVYVNFNLFSGCDQLTCDIENREEYKVFSGIPRCVCKRPFTLRNGVCETRTFCYHVGLRFTMQFDNILLNLFADFTIRFKNLLEIRLYTALLFWGIEIVNVVEFYSGSTITEFDVLLPANTTETETSIMRNLENDIFSNTTKSLFHYFPTAADANNTFLGVNCNHLFFSILIIFPLLKMP